MTHPTQDPAGGFPDESLPSATSVQPEDGRLEVTIHPPEMEEWQQDFTGLLNLGSIRCHFDWCGHRISLRTLTTEEELLVGQLMKEHEGSMAGMKAYATATAALAVEAIDGKSMPVPLGEDPSRPFAWASQRFSYACRWYPPTIDAILEAYLQLEVRQREVISQMGKASAQAAGVTPG